MFEIGARKNIPNDPAPSRWSYKLLRLMLSPFLRRLVFYGVPVFLLMVVTAINLSDENRRDQLRTFYDEIYLSVVERPEFMVNLMSITGASDEVMQDIREVVSVDFPISSFSLDLDHMQKEISGLDPVKHAELRISSGGVLEVKVIERIPAYLWRREAGLEVLDETGAYVKNVGSRLDYPRLPLIAGEGADLQILQVEKLLKAAQPLENRLRGLVFVGERRWDVVLDRGQVLMLPEEGAASALERIIVMDDAEELLARNIRVVDFRIRNRPTLHLKEGAMEELKEIKLMQLRPSE